MPGSSRLQLDTWGCDASPEANPAPCRQQIYATNVGQRVSVLVYTYCLSLCTCGGNRHGRVVAAPAIWTHPKLPSRIQTNTVLVLMRDGPPCPDSECRRAAAQVVPISCGYYFRATQILRIKNQIWPQGPATDLWGLGSKQPLSVTERDSCAGVEQFAYSRRKQPWIRDSTDNVLLFACRA